MYLLDRLTGLLPVKLQDRAKAIYPALGTLVATGAHWASTGEFDRVELVTIVTGMVASLLTYSVPNRKV